MTQNKLTVVLIVLLITSNAILCCLLYAKKASAPTVALVFDKNQAGHTTLQGMGQSAFWNNYPYLVLPSEGRKIDTNVTLTNAPNPLLRSIGGSLVFRFFPSQRFSANDTILKLVARHNRVVVLSDKASITQWNKCRPIYGFNNKVYILSQEMNLGCERIRKPYFFMLTEDARPVNIYFPREEVPQVTQLYLEDNLKRVP